MRHIFFSLGILTLFFLPHNQVKSQMMQPVKWTFSSEKTGENEYTLVFTAAIDDEWKVYAHDVDPSSGILGANVHFDLPKTGVELIGEAKELGRKEEKAEPLFDNAVLRFYHKKLIIRQQVKITKDVTVKGYVEYQSCNESMCLPADEADFSFDLKAENASGQNVTNGLLQPVTWTFSSDKIPGTENEYYVHFKAKIDDGWKLYSQTVKEGGPTPTSFHFNKAENNAFVFTGSVEELGDMQEKAEPVFDGLIVKYYKHNAEFRQKIKVNGSNAVVKGSFEFQTCDDTRCLPPETDEFAIDVLKGEVVANIDSTQQMDTGSAVITTKSFKIDSQPFQSCNVDGGTATVTDAGKASLWLDFIKGFLGGLIGLLMPCTFPMIPFTITFFTKRNTSRKKGIFESAFYGFSIILIFFIVSIPFIIFNWSGDTLNEFSTNMWVNLAFFVIFIVFAISLFGAFEIRLPNSWANRSERASDVGGLIGIFFMALTLCIVSFSCTGPILGFLLANNANSGGYGLAAGMVGFGTAFAIAFTLLAVFPQLLKKMPKSGGWLHEIKVVFAFIELAFAIKFFSNADLVEHWGILKREIFIGCWTLLSLITFLYIVGVIRFAHDEKKVKYTLTRIFFGLLFLSCSVYLSTGLRKNANLSLISGFAPPMFYTVYHTETKCPLGLDCYHDLDEAVAVAREQNKPVMIDFTGWACVNCRKMEEHVWPKDEVYNLISNKYVLVSLYVDDKASLPDSLQYISGATGKKVKTIGNKWSDIQFTYFNQYSQPWYVLISPDGKVLTDSRGYTPDADTYADFLQCGLDSYQQISSVAKK